MESRTESIINRKEVDFTEYVIKGFLLQIYNLQTMWRL